jgi:hypothetical protein
MCLLARCFAIVPRGRTRCGRALNFWPGLALAPDDSVPYWWLFVSNFRDGYVNVFQPESGWSPRQLNNENGSCISIEVDCASESASKSTTRRTAAGRRVQRSEERLCPMRALRRVVARSE